MDVGSPSVPPGLLSHPNGRSHAHFLVEKIVANYMLKEFREAQIGARRESGEGIAR